MSTKRLFSAHYPLTRILVGAGRHQLSSIQQNPHFHTTTTRLENDSKSELVIDDSAVKQLCKVAVDGSFLRISVEGGGCSGFQYKFDLDNKTTEEDEVFEKAGTRVVVDKMSLDLISGSTIAFEESLMSSAFQVTKNPLADTGCSCGVSFSLKL